MTNLTARERGLRLCLAVALMVLGWATGDGGWQIVARVAALYPLITALLGWSPARALRLFDSRRR